MANPDYVYDPDNWEVTYCWGERGELTDGPDTDGTVYEFATLLKGPPTYAAWVVKTFTEDGDDDDGDWEWFRTREGAEAAVKLARSKRGPAPSHTDLMVPPESIDAFMEANPLPPDQEEKIT
jgi:hypothetical protein